MKIKVISNNPSPGQESIDNLIGKEFLVKYPIKDEDGKLTGRVAIDAKDWDGAEGMTIILNPSEYKVVFL